MRIGESTYSSLQGVPLTALLLACFLVVGACGGSSGSSSGDSTSDSGDSSPGSGGGETAPAEGTLQGRAFKGILLDAVVTASRWDQGAWVQMDQTRTGSEGWFTVDVGSGTAPVRITVRTDSNSQMICDFPEEPFADCPALGTAFGDPGFIFSGLELHSITPGTRTGEYVAVSPLTDMAAEWAVAMPGPPTNRGARAALHRVADLFAIDRAFVWTKPIDITEGTEVTGAGATARQHGWLGAALGHLVITSDSPTSYLSNLASDFATNLGQVSGDWLQDLAPVLQDVTAKVKEQPDMPSDFPAITALMDALEAKPSGYYREGLSNELGSVDRTAALQVLDDLDTYLRRAGVDTQGTFLTDLDNRIGWPVEGSAREENLAMAALATHTLMHSAAVALVHEDLPSISQCDPISNYSSTLSGAGLGSSYPLTIFGDSLPAGYTDDDVQLCPDAQSATVAVEFDTGSTEIEGQLATNRVEIELLEQSSTGRRVRFDVAMDMNNSFSTGKVPSGTIVEIEINDDTAAGESLAGLIDYLKGDSISSGRKDAMRQLDLSWSLNGSATLTNTADADQYYSVSGDFSGVFDVPRLLDEDGILFQAQAQAAGMETTDTNGDSVLNFGLRDSSGALPVPGTATLNAGTNSSLLSGLDFQGLGLSTIELNNNGALEQPPGFFRGLVDFYTTTALPANDPAYLDVQDDMETLVRDAARSAFPHYRKSISGNRVTVENPDTGDTMLSYYQTGDNGGYIYANEALIGQLYYLYDIEGRSTGMEIQLTDELRPYRIRETGDRMAAGVP